MPSFNGNAPLKDEAPPPGAYIFTDFTAPSPPMVARTVEEPVAAIAALGSTIAAATGRQRTARRVSPRRSRMVFVISLIPCLLERRFGRTLDFAVLLQHGGQRDREDQAE